MAAGRRHLQRPFGALLALDIGKVGEVGGIRSDRRFGARQDLGAAEMIGERNQATRREDIDVWAGPCGLRAAFGRAYQPLPLPIALAAIAAGSAPATGAIVPSRLSSPTTV